MWKKKENQPYLDLTDSDVSFAQLCLHFLSPIRMGLVLYGEEDYCNYSIIKINLRLY